MGTSRISLEGRHLIQHTGMRDTHYVPAGLSLLVSLREAWAALPAEGALAL
jgi:hypothetical protein